MTRDEIAREVPRGRAAAAAASRSRPRRSTWIFSAGGASCSCAAWANPTYNVRGWRGPCYLLADAHYATYRELIDATDWDQLGPAAIPAAATAWSTAASSRPPCSRSEKGFRDVLRMAVWQMT